MRTKLILGLAVGVMTVVQIGSAQGVSTGIVSDEIYGNVVAPVALYTVVAVGNPVAKYHSESDANVGDSSFDWSADGAWLNFGTAPGLSAVGNDFASTPFSSSSDADLITRSSDNSPVAMAANEPVGSVHMPEVATPEPGTVGLLVFGGAALAGTLRRKLTA